jgi:nucleotidyltransferase/DNA polymerase involved in DNA repair
LSLSKVLAKVASKHQKPNGFTPIPGRMIAAYLEHLPVQKIWGIGHATANYLNKMGVRTALEFARLPEETVRKRFTKPGVEIWRELRGESVYPVCPDEKSTYASISKTKTFAPASSDANYLFAHLMRNLESACIKARRYCLAPKRIAAFLKRSNFDYVGREIRLNRPSVYPMELTFELRHMFAEMHSPKDLYRATGIVLMELSPNANIQMGLFEDALKAEKVRDIYKVADEISAKYGKHSLHLGASHFIEMFGKGRRGEPTAREQMRLLGETKRRHLDIPVLHIKV